MQYLRSVLFVIQMYVAMAVVGLVFAPWAVFSSRGAHMACHTYCVWVRWTLAWMCGLRTEVRGTPPTGQVIVASKHQSFLDIILVYGAMPRGFFIMKKILMYAPILGQYGLRIGCVGVNRGKRGAAIKKMLADVAANKAGGGQLIIFPQGTRVAPGDTRPYKVGTAALYEQMGQPCVPVAANVGVFWPKRGILRKPGLAVVEFLDPIEPGLGKEMFLARLEEAVESNSDRLMREAGYEPGE